ncbi:MAG TPA: hypothetical protein VK480_04130 [Solirubrobacterales bacterium]|nr:hypothetical protein [Solirubrobacterales bacterium]
MRSVRRIAAILLVLAVFGAALLLAAGLYPADLPVKQDPTFIDTVFDNRAVIWMARLLLVSAVGVLACGGVFIVLSIGMRIKNGEWLRRAGPFEVSEVPAGRIEDEVEFWHRETLAAWGDVENLTECLQKANELLGRIQND